MAVRRCHQLLFVLSVVACLSMFSALHAARVTDGLVVGYDFREGSGTTIADRSGFGTPLDLTIFDPPAVTWNADNSVTLTEATIISSGSDMNVGSEGTAEKIFDAITDTEEITMEAWIVPDNVVENGGPARIVTMSINQSNRNFTLGQDEIEYQMRLRTTEAGNNGFTKRVATDDAVVLDGDLQHFVYTRDEDGEAIIYVNGEIVPVGFGDAGENPIDGDLSNWNENYDFALGNELTWDDIEQRDWLGTYYLVALYNRALTEAEVLANFDAGESALIGGPTLLGDFDGSGVLDGPDIDDLTQRSASLENPIAYDLNGDTVVDDRDVKVWIKDLLNSWIGDADADKKFDSGDLVMVLAAGTFGKDIDSVWSTGDFNGDGRTNSGDLVIALADGGFGAGLRPATAAVPEPSALALVSLGVLFAVRFRRQRTQL